MRIVVFCGPTISAKEVEEHLEAEVRPPATRGDILAAALDGPDAIALIDGYFDRVPAVWHKEILWAMSHGVHVFGSSSMGALRAAELAAFGMVGKGEVFEAFASGELEDDDEVAVAHADAESGYRPLSEAMVNVRWTLREAERAGIIPADLRVELESLAKELPYERRSLRAVLEGNAIEARRAELSALRDWLPSGRLDQKRADARVLLEELQRMERVGWSKKQVDYEFAETDGWAALHAQVESTRGHAGDQPIDVGLAGELRARGLLGKTIVAATARWLSVERLRDARVALNARAIEAWIDQFRRDRELYTPESFDGWLQASGLEDDALEGFFRREAVVAATRAEALSRLGGAVEDELRSRGQLLEMKRAAKRREFILGSSGLSSPSIEGTGLDESELWSWFFRKRLGVDVPTSILAYASAEASTVDELRQTALEEFWLERSLRVTGSDGWR